jgi:16S rRNA processing protein RimM
LVQAPDIRLRAPEPGDPAWPDDAVEVGRILGAWGIKGGFKVQAFSADPQALFSSRRWFLQPPADVPGRVVAPPSAAPRAAAAKAAAPKAAPVASLPPLLKITLAREQGDVVVAQAQEVPDRNAAEALRGARVFISRGSFPSAQAGEYYWIDLIGLSVFNREGAELGTVTGLLDTGPHSVLRIQRPDAPAGAPLDESERLIPFVGAFIDDVDLAGRRIKVDWGLDF